MECLKNIIGITKTECPCIIEGLTPEEIAELRESESGLYMDDLAGGVNFQGIKFLDTCKDFAKMNISARDLAIKTLMDDVTVALSKKYKAGKPAYIGFIGKPTYASTLNLTNQYQFLKITPRTASDAVVRLQTFKFIADRTASIDFKILKVGKGFNQFESIVFEKTVEAVANAYVVIELPRGGLPLPLRENSELYEYFIVWDRGITGMNTKDIKCNCNCGAGSDEFGGYIEVSGGQLDSLDNLNEATKDAYTHGISLNVDIRCVTGDLICREYNNEDAVAVTMAWATMYKTGELLIESVMASKEVNRYTLMNREYLWGKRNHFIKEYESRVHYLADQIDINSSDCFVCKDPKFINTGIIS